MPLLAQQLLPIFTVFVNIRRMLRNWWNNRASSSTTDPPLPPQPAGSIIHITMGRSVELDKLRIRSVEVDPQDPTDKTLHDHTSQHLTNMATITENPQNRLLSRDSTAARGADAFANDALGPLFDHFTKTNALEFFLKSLNGDDNCLVQNPGQMHVTNEGRVDAVRSTEQPENLQVNLREPLHARIDVNRACLTATVNETWISWIRYHLQWRHPFSRSRAKSYTVEQSVQLSDNAQPDMNGREEGTGTAGVDTITETCSGKNEAILAASRDVQPKNTLDSVWVNTTERNQAQRQKPAGTNQSNSVQTSSDPSTSLTSKSENSDTSQAPFRNKVERTQDVQNTSTNPNNRTTVCAFVGSFKNAKFSWNNPFKRMLPAKRDSHTQPTPSKSDQMIPGSQSKTKTNIQETTVVPFSANEDGVTSSAVTQNGVTNDTVTSNVRDVPGTSANTNETFQVERTQDAQNTSTNPSHRTTVCAFVDSFKNAKFSWNNPFKRILPAHKDSHVQPMASKSDHITLGNQSKTKTNIQETPVVPFNANEDGVTSSVVTQNGVTNDTVTCGVRDVPGTSADANQTFQPPFVTPAKVYNPADRSVKAWGIHDEVSTSKTADVPTRTNDYTPASLFLASKYRETASNSNGTAACVSIKEASTSCEVSRITSGSSQTGSSNKKNKFSLFRSKIKTGASEGSKPRRFSKRKVTVYPH